MIKKLVFILRTLLRPIFRPLAGLFRAILAQLAGASGKRRRRARQLARQITSELGRLGFTKRVVLAGRRRRGRVRRQRVEFESPLLMTADELWLPLNLPRLPTGVSTDDLRDESVLRSLMDRTDCAVRIDYLANGKLCYVVRYGGAQFPEKFGVNQVEFPDDAGQLVIPAGVNADGDQVFIDLDNVIHVLVAGATGGGKTTFEHVALTTLINRNTADDLQLWLIDLKQTEFALYRPLYRPKTNDGIVKALAVEPEDAIDVLDRALREINRRNQLMVSHNVTSIDDLATSTGMRLPKVVIVIDEFAQLTLNTSKLGKQSIGKIAENFITRIAALGRSAGFRIIIATQMVQSAVVSSLIRANFENRLAFSTADWRQSQLIVETSEADGIPRGRAVMRLRGEIKMVQTCLISPRQVRIEIERVAQFGPDGAWGEDLELIRFVKDSKLIIAAACQHYSGELARAKILSLEGIRGVISQDRFNEVAQRLERDGVVEAGGRGRARRVAKGFFNRPHLVDQLYGLVESFPAGPTTGPTIALNDSDGLVDNELVFPEQKAVDELQKPDEQLVVGLEKPATHGDEADPPPPSWWKQIDPAASAPEEASVSKRKRAKIAKSDKTSKRFHR